MQDLYTSIVRTTVPYFVAFILSVLASYGLTPLDGDFAANLTGFLTFVFGAIYYIVVRLVARKYPRIEWLLGSPVKPEYRK